MSNNKVFKVQGELMWVSSDKVNEMSGKYQADVCNLSAAAIKAIEEVGGKVANRPDKPEKGFYVTVKSNYAIPVVDGNGAQILDKVGNGSKGIVVIQPYEWTFKGKKGVGLGAAKIVVKELVTYRDSDSLEEDDDDVL